MKRREFLNSVAAAGAGMALAQSTFAEDLKKAAEKKGVDDLNVVIIGTGAEGRILIEACMNIPGIKFKAVCDIWAYNQQYGYKLLKKKKHPVTAYEDYREMLAKEKDIDAAIVATPDWMHAEHTNACLNAGLHVYCEKEMSNSLVKAKSMVDTAKATGKLLQIGHQRRSNPRYIHAFDTLLEKEKLLGRVTHATAQWNRSKSAAKDIVCPPKLKMSAEKLTKYGYASMHEFRNWRWYKKYGGGPIVDLGSHQIDLFAWVFGSNPKSVIASGGVDFYQQHEWYDNVLCIFEYENKQGTSRAFYETLTTSGHGGFSEAFMGEDGTLLIAELPSQGNSVKREDHAKSWDVYAKKGMLKSVSAPVKKKSTSNTLVDVRVSAPMAGWPLPITLAKPAHQPHLENFFDAIRFGQKLNCPGEVGYETAVAVLACNDAVRTNKKINFKKEDFHA